MDIIKKDKFDARDYIYSIPSGAQQLPGRVDLRQYAGSIENQGRTNSCVANATVKTAVNELIGEAGEQ